MHSAALSGPGTRAPFMVRAEIGRKSTASFPLYVADLLFPVVNASRRGRNVIIVETDAQKKNLSRTRPSVYYARGFYDARRRRRRVSTGRRRADERILFYITRVTATFSWRYSVSAFTAVVVYTPTVTLLLSCPTHSWPHCRSSQPFDPRAALDFVLFNCARVNTGPSYRYDVLPSNPYVRYTWCWLFRFVNPTPSNVTRADVHDERVAFWQYAFVTKSSRRARFYFYDRYVHVLSYTVSSSR